MSNPSIQPRYLPLNPSEPQSIASSIQVLRTRDNKIFLATQIPDTVCKDVKSSTYTTRLADAIIPSAQKPMSLILNHPNIISLIDIVRNTQEAGAVSEAGRYSDITIWEDMDAGALSYVLPLANTYPKFEDAASWHALTTQNFQRFSLPEGLCWHVLRSISRALLWLHHGVKETIDIPGEWLPHDVDWQAVLVMDVSPGQIWFKHPRGDETYGECKLGGFTRARICGSVNAQIAMAPRDDTMPLVKQHFWAPEVYQNIFSPSRQSEIWSLGATVYCMMTGIPPPRLCSYDWQISRMNDKGFTKGIRDIVALMLNPHPKDRPAAIDLVNTVDDAFDQWRATTAEGAMYVDRADKLVRERGGGLLNL